MKEKKEISDWRPCLSAKRSEPNFLWSRRILQISTPKNSRSKGSGRFIMTAKTYFSSIAACAAANLAIGTRNGEQLT